MKILAAESRQRYNIVQSLCATEPRHGERKVRRDNKHNCFFDAGCSLVKYPSRLLASGRIETGNNVKDFSLAGVICERYICQILVGQREIGNRLALRRQTARYRYRFAFQRYSGHIVPLLNVGGFYAQCSVETHIQITSKVCLVVETGGVAVLECISASRKRKSPDHCNAKSCT